ncbi:hypothetical protein FD754_024765 [Muntiacus muntjak]|uniref:USP domain-containing protein n=1 Tax=Muntiacus muntjak TaxID=9888 RepID=A0A5N3UN98_MUNMU|nr:hypothetical protein FD754_024766 [Muntiacus muntjak]KAB0338179.1 hypothetical protein FD754_024765 [Muntiacus muntjak]
MGSWGVGARLQNLGNTCYVKTALQCLSHTLPLASWMVSQHHTTLCRAHTSCTLCTMRAHVTRAILHPGEVIRPRKDLLVGFHRHQQEVAHEFLMFTLNAMQQGCLSASQPLGHPSEDTTLIRQIFGKTWRSQIQCLHCLGVSDTFDPYLDISLYITAPQSVEQALRKLDCGICLRKVPATKRLTLHSTSQVLVIVLKRFTQVSRAKMAQEVRYPQCLDMQPYRSEQKAGPLDYVLYAVLVHSGWSCERGHYFSYVRAGNSQWYKMDAAKVTACDESAALSQSAYIHFYSQEGAWEGVEPAGDNSGRSPGSQVSPGDTEVEGISLEQWRRLQEHNRPKLAFDLRKIQSALPAGAVVIHQFKHGGGRNSKLPEQENDGLDHTTSTTGTNTMTKGRKATQRVPKKLLHQHGTGS